MPVYKQVNKNFFKKWTPEMAYVLGFFAADGYITKNKRGGQFWCFQITDGDLLFKIRQVIGSSHKIGVRPARDSNSQTSYRLQIGSIEMCSDLSKLGFGPKKTNNLLIPDIPDKFLPDFVRGYFDGDGNVWVGYLHKNRKTPNKSINTVFTSCSGMFLKNLLNKLRRFGVQGGYLHKSKVGNYYRLSFSINDSFKLYKFMYNTSCSLFLKRKKVVFEKFFKNAVVV